MKKRIIAVLCAVILMCTALPITASAAGNIEGVDYTRIKGTAGGKEVILTLGDLQFHGELTNGSLNDEERDQIIRKAMNDMKITSGMLINAETLIKQAQNVQGFGTSDVVNALAKLAGVSDLLSIYNYFMGTGKDPETIAKDIATSQITDAAKDQLEDVLTDGGKLVLKGGGKFAFKLLFILPDLTEIGLDALAKYEDIKYKVTLGTEKMIMLEAFYQECNNRIEEKEKELGGWVIRFDKATATDNFTFWGISGLMSEWTLSGELVKGISGAGDGVTGNYEGVLTLEMRALDMKETFDSSFVANHNCPFKQNLEYWKYSVQGFNGYNDTVNKTTELKRTVSGEISLYLVSKSGIADPEVFGKFNNDIETVFSFDHTITAQGTIGISTFKNTAHITSNDATSADFSEKHIMITNMPMVGPDERVTLEQQLTGIPTDVGTVWEPLDSEISMTINFGR